MSAPCCCPSGREENSLPEYESCPELALAALLTLMTSFPARRSPALARSVLAHLRVVSQDGRLDGILRECASQLMASWEALEVLSESGAGPLSEQVRIIN